VELPSDSVMMQGTEAVSIIVPCYDRIALLERTLRACFKQNLPTGMRWEILVCDNHPDQLARSLVDRLQHAAPVPLRYLPAPARNIARARNVGVEAAIGRYIAFVDDDEAPDPNWLESYFACLERTGADAAFGPKFPEFSDGVPPEWDPTASHYTTDFQVPADARIGRVGRSGRVLGAGNSFMRVATCLNTSQPFDEKLGAADGEDTLLYFRLLKQGRRFVWCPTAIVREVMPESRLTYGYMRKRLKQGSKTSARCRMSVTSHKLSTHSLLIVVGLAQVLVHSVLFGVTGEFLTRRRVHHRLGIARGLGKLTYRSGEVSFIDEKIMVSSAS
jgi:succinoglycan biosynthesis protein ExoM